MFNNSAGQARAPLSDNIAESQWKYKIVELGKHTSEMFTVRQWDSLTLQVRHPSLCLTMDSSGPVQPGPAVIWVENVCKREKRGDNVTLLASYSLLQPGLGNINGLPSRDQLFSFPTFTAPLHCRTSAQICSLGVEWSGVAPESARQTARPDLPLQAALLSSKQTDRQRGLSAARCER